MNSSRWMRGGVLVALAVIFCGAPRPSASGGERRASSRVPPIPPVLSITHMGTVKQNPVVTGRDGTFSTLVDGRSVWTFGDTSMSIQNKFGSYWDDNSMAAATNLDATHGITLNQDYEPGSPAPIEFLPYTAAEARYNAEHNSNHCTKKPCGANFAMWGGPVVWDSARGRLLLFYDEIWRIAGQSSWKNVGAGIAVGTRSGGIVRPIENPGGKIPNLMWSADETAYGCGSLIVGDMLYSYACVLDYVVMNYQLARVPLSDALDKTKWTYYAGGENWSANPADAVTVFQGGDAGSSVFYNAYLGDYMAIYSQPLSDDIYFRVAYAPEGPWSDQTLLFTGQAAWNNGFDYAGLAHPEFAQGNGQTQYVTYAHATGLLQMDEPLTRVVFGQPKR